MRKLLKRIVVAVAFVAIGLEIATPTMARGPGDARESPVFSEDLPDIPGKRLTAVVVDYPPGGKSPRHRHTGDVFAFIISGAVRSQNSATGAVRVYRAGETFFEPAGSVHLVSENASTTEPARFLATFVSDKGAKLTTAEH
jgi:quercetin dioxygenase-like cupin family protein